MKKNKYILFLLLFPLFLYFILSDNVNALCYKVSDGNGGYNYVENPDTRTRMSATVVDDSYCKSNDSDKNYDKGNLVSCGYGLITDMPRMVPKVIHIIYLFIQIAVPLLILIFGSIDFLKAVIASKEDEIKKGQQIFIRRLITGIIVFFIFSLVKLFISVVGDSNNKANVINCFSCIINNDENCVAGV